MTSARAVTSSPVGSAAKRKTFNRRPSVEFQERVASLDLGSHKSMGIIPPSLVKNQSSDSAEGSTPMGRELLDLPLVKGWMSKVSG